MRGKCYWPPNASRLPSHMRGQKLRRYRRDFAKMTQAELARVLLVMYKINGVYWMPRVSTLQQYISGWECGTRVMDDDDWDALQRLPGFPNHP